jgi:hypothetical protein
MIYITNFLLPLLGVLTALFLAAATYLSYQQMKVLKAHDSEANPNYNPFFYGNPVSPDKFIGRKAEVRRIAGRIINGGQSSAITGTFRSGKTSILDYLAAPTEALYGNKADRLIFSYWDAKTLSFQCDQTQFWRHVLEPLKKRITELSDASLSKTYQACQKNHFANIEELIAQIGSMNWQFVLMIDEFDVLLERPHLNNTEFFGGLRQLASRSRGALVLVLATNISLTKLHQKTTQFSKSGSPYLNFLDEIVLGPLSDSEIEKLLYQNDTLFSAQDCQFIKDIGGGYPFLLQVAASSLWESYQNRKEEDLTKIKLKIKKECYERTKITLNNIWQSWLPTTRKAFTAVALINSKTLKNLLKIQLIDIEEIINDEPAVKQALEELEKQGFVKDHKGHWQVYPTIFLSFIAKQPAQELCKLFEENYHSN